ncbi:MFS transporter [Streptomyces sp. UC4497]
MYLLVVLTVGGWIPSPLYPSYQQAMGFSDLTLTVIYATFPVVSAPVLVLCGPIYDRFGARPLLRLSVILAMCASACLAVAGGAGWLLAGRAVQGLALAAATVAGTGLIVQHAIPGQRSRASLVASLAFVAGTAAGPVGSGVLAQYSSAPLIVPYVLVLALLLVGWCQLLSVAPSRADGGRQWRLQRPRVPHGIRFNFLTASAVGVLAWTVASIFLALVPSVVTRSLQTGNLALVGGVISTVMICSLLAQLVFRHWSASRAQMVGVTALIAALLALGGLGDSDSLGVLVLPALCAGVGHGLGYRGATASVDAIAPPGSRGAVSGVLYMCCYLAAGLPAVAVGLMTLWCPFEVAVSWLVWSAAGFGVLTLAAAFAQARISRQSSVAEPVEDSRSGRWSQRAIGP